MSTMFADTLLIVFISVCTALLAEGARPGRARNRGRVGGGELRAAGGGGRLLGGEEAWGGRAGGHRGGVGGVGWGWVWGCGGC